MFDAVIASKNAGKIREIQEIMEGLPMRFLTAEDVGDWPDVEELGRTYVENALLKAVAVSKATGLPVVADDSGLEVDALDGRPGVMSARFAGPNATDEDNNIRLASLLHGVPPERRRARYRCASVFFSPAGAAPDPTAPPVQAAPDPTAPPVQAAPDPTAPPVQAARDPFHGPEASSVQRPGDAVSGKQIDAPAIMPAPPHVPVQEEVEGLAHELRAAPSGSLVIVEVAICEGWIATEPKGTGGFGYDPWFIPEGESRRMAELTDMEKNHISHRGKAFRGLRRQLEARLGAV